jgi:hypothetical protein
MIKSEQRIITFIVPRRGDDEHTFAVVEARVDRDFADESANDISALFDAIQRAVSRWVRSTERGQSVIRSNHNDFNLGDLAEWKDDESLVTLLRDQGIWSMSIVTYSDSTGHSWEFDDALFDETEISADPNREREP